MIADISIRLLQVHFPPFMIKLIEFRPQFVCDAKIIEGSSANEETNQWTMKSSENDGAFANCYSSDPLNCPMTN
jgi:hypothetical protein